MKKWCQEEREFMIEVNAVSKDNKPTDCRMGLWSSGSQRNQSEQTSGGRIRAELGEDAKMINRPRHWSSNL